MVREKDGPVEGGDKRSKRNLPEIQGTWRRGIGRKKGGLEVRIDYRRIYKKPKNHPLL